MRKTLILLSLAMLCLPATAAETKTGEQIEAAITRLSSDNWKDRQKAQETLVSFGEQALPRLKELAEKSPDEEVRTRAGAALRQIEENGQLGGSVITLHVKDAKPADVFAELGKQARADFPTYPKNLFTQNNNFPVLTLDFERVNFWTAFKEACQKTGVCPQQMGNERKMTLQQGGSSYWNGPSVVQGPFLIVANRAHKSSSVDFSGGNTQQDFSLSLSAFAEPKIRVIQSSYNVKVEEATDDKGNSLVSKDKQYEGMSTGQQWMWNLNARLTWPENGVGTKLTRFKGSVKFLIQVKSETLDVPDILTVKDLQKTVAGRRMMIKQCKKNGEQYEVQMTFFRDGMNQNDWNAMGNPGYSLRLLDKNGKSLNSHGWGGGGGMDKMDYNWTFGRDNWGGEEKAGDPFRLVWEIPVETREVDVTFEFKDLPLPR